MVSRILRALVGICLLAPGLVLAQTPTPIPITGNLGTLSGGPQPYAGILIQLQNCASPVLVTGYYGIVATQYRLMANASGVINSTIWANDQITCNGTTGASQYSEVAIVGGVPSGQPQCYQVTAAQGIWNLNTQQPIPCGYTPPDPQDATFRNLNVTGFFQGNNGAMSGTWTVNGLMWAKGGFQLGTTDQNCSSGAMTGLSDMLLPICNPIAGFLTSFNGRTTPAAIPQSGDYNYAMISSTPVFGATPAPPTGLTNVTWQQSGTANSAYIPATGVSAGSFTQANVTVGLDGRVTAISSGSSTATDYYETTGNPSFVCTPGTSTDSVCSGSIPIPTQPDTSYQAFLTINAGNVANLAINLGGSKTTTSVPYNITCTFTCGTINQPVIDVHIHHN